MLQGREKVLQGWLEVFPWKWVLVQCRPNRRTPTDFHRLRVRFAGHRCARDAACAGTVARTIARRQESIHSHSTCEDHQGWFSDFSQSSSGKATLCLMYVLCATA
ncbi:unnamed protein product [Heligmosomoides polygyrus]|uniref:Uncharacterized protein n=1 Tax=Heligmosomoides polygyrus TaxID=6339 RepID=A0A3P8B804_HELPZ|nr:unnamed protein product [Heligmosomoides polygyrus]